MSLSRIGYLSSEEQTRSYNIRYEREDKRKSGVKILVVVSRFPKTPLIFALQAML